MDHPSIAVQVQHLLVLRQLLVYLNALLLLLTRARDVLAAWLRSVKLLTLGTQLLVTLLRLLWGRRELLEAGLPSLLLHGVGVLLVAVPLLLLLLLLRTKLPLLLLLLLRTKLLLLRTKLPLLLRTKLLLLRTKLPLLLVVLLLMPLLLRTKLSLMLGVLLLTQLTTLLSQ